MTQIVFISAEKRQLAGFNSNMQDTKNLTAALQYEYNNTSIISSFFLRSMACLKVTDVL